MDINSYATLQSYLADMLNRRDLTEQIKSHINLAESQISRDIRHWRMENRAQITQQERYFALPTDWVETIRLQLVGGRPLEMLSRKVMQQWRDRQTYTDSEPRFYRHSENAFEIYPVPSAEMQFELEYYQKIPDLNDTDTTNWLLTEFPDVYVYGAALHSYQFLKDTARMGDMAQLYSAASQRVNGTGEEAESSGSSLRLRKFGMRQSSRPNRRAGYQR